MKQQNRIITGFLVASTLVGFAAVGSAAAQNNMSRSNYVQVKAGAMIPTDTFDDAGYDTGFTGGVSYGRYFGPHLILEGTVEGAGSKSERNGSATIVGPYHQKDELSITDFLLTLKGEYGFNRVNVYGGGGVGAYYVYLNSKVDSNLYGTFKNDDSDFVFGAHLVVGANYDITDQFFLGVEGTYRWTEDVDINKTAVTVPVAYNDNLDGCTISATFGMRF